MIIVLNNWRILPEKVSGFVEFWSALELQNSTGLIGEFLCSVERSAFFEKITWELEPSQHESDKSFWKSEKYVSFVNVSMWESLADLDLAVGKLIDVDPKAMNKFEAAPRRRAILTPNAWRLGTGTFPEASSEGVIS